MYHLLKGGRTERVLFEMSYEVKSIECVFGFFIQTFNLKAKFRFMVKKITYTWKTTIPNLRQYVLKPHVLIKLLYRLGYGLFNNNILGPYVLLRLQM